MTKTHLKLLTDNNGTYYGVQCIYICIYRYVYDILIIFYSKNIRILISQQF
jgi:hypothetical protein